MKQVKFYGTIGAGKMEWDLPQVLAEWIKSQSGGPVRVEVTIKPVGKDPTAEQRGYYFACIVEPLAAELGYTKEEMEFELDRALLLREGTHGQKYLRSKSKLNSDEWSELIQSAIMLAAKVGVVVQPPSKDWRVKKKG